MKRKILKITNSLLRPFGAEIVKNISDHLQMSSAIKRINTHAIRLKTIIDIGASDGKWSLTAMKFFPDASVIAIEPLRERLTALENLKQKYASFDYELCAAGETDVGQIMLNVSNDLDGSTVDGTDGKPRQVLAKTIDTIVSEKKMEGPFLLKFDTHGYEIPILNSAEETLRKTDVIIMEVYNFQITAQSLRFHEMCLHMEKLGFRCYDIADPMLRRYDKSFWQMDLFFCRKESKIFSYSQYK